MDNNRKILLRKAVLLMMNYALEPLDVVVKSLEIDKEVILVDYTLNKLKREFVPLVQIEEIASGTFLNTTIVAEVKGSKKYEIELIARISVGEKGLKVTSVEVLSAKLPKGGSWTDKIRILTEKWGGTLAFFVKTILEIMQTRG